MADITALFMSGAGPAPARPQRTPPGGAPLPPAHPQVNGGAVAKRLDVRELPHEERESSGAMNGLPLIVQNSALQFGNGILDSMAASKKIKIADAAKAPVVPVPLPEKLPRVQAALLDHSTAGGYRDLLEAAKLLAAQQGIAIGIIGRDECMLRLSRVDGASRNGHVATHIEVKKGPVDLQIARQLFALRQTVDHWIIAVPRIGMELSRRMLAVVPDWLMVSSSDTDAIIASYRLLKGVCALPNAGESSIRLLLQTSDRAAAGRLFARLNHAAKEFLDQELTLLAPSSPADARVEPIAEFAVVDHEGDDSETIWTAVLEFVHDLQNIDPEESPALSADTIELDGTVPDERELAAASVLDPAENAALLQPVSELHPQEQAEEVQPGRGLRVCESTGDLFELKDALSDLIPGAIFLEARSPMNAPSLLAADGSGTLHVWMMADGADLTSWGSMWQWANEHRQLISLTRPDLSLGAESPVQMHLILPADAPRAIRAPLPGVLYYRLHTLRWDGKTATAVIPLG